MATKIELARGIIDALNMRESSYTGLYEYGMTYAEAVAATVEDEELHPLITAILMTGYTDFIDWARETIRRHDNDHHGSNDNA